MVNNKAVIWPARGRPAISIIILGAYLRDEAMFAVNVACCHAHTWSVHVNQARAPPVWVVP